MARTSNNSEGASAPSPVRLNPAALSAHGAYTPDADWDGTETELQLAYPIVRNHKFLARGDYASFRAALINGRWVGPEAIHVQDLWSAGTFAGTDEAERRANDTAAVNIARGAGAVAPLLTAREFDSQPPVVKRGLVGDPKKLLAMEYNERKDEEAASDALARKIGREVAQSLSRDYAGAEGPSSAKNPDGTPVV